jgi:hypothetical protein
MAASELVMTNGGTPSTPSAGKSTIFVNSAKKLAFVDDAGLVTALVGGAATHQSSPGDPSGTTNTTGLMMGLAGSITPAVSGKIVLTINGTIANSNASDGAKVQLSYGTGTAPVNGAAITGTQVGAFLNVTNNANTAALKVPYSVTAVITGLTVGTAYWLDVVLAAITAGTATITVNSIAAHEIL